MKKIIAMLALGLIVSGASFAQEAPKKERKQRTEFHAKKEGKKDRKSPEEKANMRTEKMSKQLGLNKSQTAKLQALNLQQAQQMQAMQASATPGDRGLKRGDEMKASRAKWEAELKSILTQKQYAQYEAERPQKRDRSDKNEQEHGKKALKHKEARSQQRS